jgi:hypothetical protein
MSMSLYVVLALKTMPSPEEINLDAKELNIPIEISVDADLSKHTGYLPINVSGNDSGVEVYVFPASELEDVIPQSESIDFGNSIAVEFRWGGNFKEAIAAFYTAQVLTMKYNGVAFDPESGIFIESEQLAQGAAAFESMPE